MIQSFLRALTELPEPGIRRWVLLSILLTVALWAALIAGTAWLLFHSQFFAVPLLDTAVDVLGSVAAVVLPALLFPGVVIAVVSLCLDQIVDAVERRHYPRLGPAREIPFALQLADALRLLGLTLLLNLLLLPLLLVPPLYLPLFYLVNGYLISREYIETIARRRLPRAEVAALRRARRGGLLAAGALVALLLTVPFVNLVAPVIGTVALVHLYHRWQGQVPA
ncbi:MAG TPA: EI24 domain-containing protein [Alphaproteobacteria bacterium]|nr:EI24 domain-containing protein [Alphaproteobacteria bacterium]